MKLQIWRVVPVSRSALRDGIPGDSDTAGIDAATDGDVLLLFSRKKPLAGVLSAVMLRTEPASLSPPGPAVNRRATGIHPDARAGLQTPPAESPPFYAPWPALTAPRQKPPGCKAQRRFARRAPSLPGCLPCCSVRPFTV
ncbi:TPA: hypothetical protein RQN91_005678 [Klebsiella michiganensis]|nr:hypothetical protein [Klebsiella michiganensis]